MIVDFFIGVISIVVLSWIIKVLIMKRSNTYDDLSVLVMRRESKPSQTTHPDRVVDPPTLLWNQPHSVILGQAGRASPLSGMSPLTRQPAYNTRIPASK